MENNSEEDIIDGYEPNLFDIHRSFENFVYYGRFSPIVGNYEARLCTALVFPLKRVSVLLKGASGSGKSRIIKCAGEAIWGRDLFKDKVPEVLYMSNASSKGYITEELMDRIEHKCTHCVVPELQNAIAGNETVESMIKLWTENEVFSYDRAEKFGRVTKKYILSPLPILTSIASENKHLERLGEEMERRFLPFYTVSNKEINEQVHKSKAKARSKVDEDLLSMTEHDKEDLRYHMKMASKIINPIKNPCAEFMQKMIPNNYVISNSQIDYWFDIVEAVTKFYYQNRPVFKTGRSKKEYLLSTPADNYIAWEIGGSATVLASMNIPDLGREVMDILPLRDDTTEDVAINLNEIIDGLSLKGIERTRKQLIGIMKSLESVSYAKRSETFKGRENFYRTKDYNFVTAINWTKCIEETIKVIKQDHPEIAERYISEYCSNPIVPHPFTNEKIKILDIPYNKQEEEERRKRRTGKVNLDELSRFF